MALEPVWNRITSCLWFDAGGYAAEDDEVTVRITIPGTISWFTTVNNRVTFRNGEYRGFTVVIDDIFIIRFSNGHPYGLAFRPLGTLRNPRNEYVDGPPPQRFNSSRNRSDPSLSFIVANEETQLSRANLSITRRQLLAARRSVQAVIHLLGVNADNAGLYTLERDAMLAVLRPNP